jgi:hypothetical protein
MDDNIRNGKTMDGSTLQEGWQHTCKMMVDKLQGYD